MAPTGTSCWGMIKSNYAPDDSPVSLIAAPFTPIQANGEIELSLIEKYAEKLIQQKVAGVFICGTTGEGMSLSQRERCEIAEAWKKAAGKRMKVIVHVGHSAIPESVDLARHAEKIGADAIATVGPIFYTPATPSALVATSREIARQVPDMPFYYYHMPSMSRPQFPASSWFAEMAEAIPSFRGVKFTHEDLVDYKKCLAIAGDRYEVFFGRDELLLAGLEAGAHSAVGSTYNFGAPLYLAMARKFRSGDLARARELQGLCTKGIEVMVRAGGLTGIRAVMAFIGLDCGHPRLPLQAPERNKIETMRRELDVLGYFEAITAAEKEIETISVR